MCDYSLHDVVSRPARVGDKLITTSFGNSITRGFAAVDDPHVAVCLMPGTEIAFEDNVECDHVFARVAPSFGFGKIGEKVARFRRINEEQRTAHHDALEFPGGRIVLVTRLCEGQRATVLQLPASQRPEPETAAPEETATPERQDASTIA